MKLVHYRTLLNLAPFACSSRDGLDQWSEQMCLWLTSPVGAHRREHGSERYPQHVFSMPTFFDVSPPNSMGARSLISHPLLV